MQTIQNGDFIEIHYATCSLEGGVIETSHSREPLRFVVGAGEVLPGLERGVVGMKPGESRRISVPSDAGFGRQSDELIESVPRSFLPLNVAVGDQLSTMVDGTPCDVWVRKLSADSAVLDANHPLAGESLIVDVEVVRVYAAAPRGSAAAHQFVIDL